MAHRTYLHKQLLLTNNTLKKKRYSGDVEMFGQWVQLYCAIGWTSSKFEWTLSDDWRLFPRALK